MSPSDYVTLRRKLVYLEQVLEELKSYQTLTEEEFFANKVHLPAVERQLQIAIESVIDCSRMFVTLKGWRRVRSEEDAFLILVQHGVLDAKLSERLLEAKKFRNVLVHLYAEVDPQRVYRHLQNDLKDLVDFARSLLPHITKEGI